jgi:phosphatidylserine decarboxylase
MRDEGMGERTEGGDVAYAAAPAARAAADADEPPRGRHDGVLDLAAQAAHLLPKNFLSYATGFAVRLRFPAPIARLLCRSFADAFRLDMSEAEKPLHDYATIEEVFTRRLKPGARQIATPLCSPADGFLARSGPLADGRTAIQAKGHDYSVHELVGGALDPSLADVDFAWFTTIYLAPHNYHRVHSPWAGRLTKIRSIPGDLWPVNKPFVARIPRLFARNERMVFDFELDGGGRAYAVMVGALNVGRIHTAFAPHLTTNTLHRVTSGGAAVEATIDRPVAAGDELGMFMLGSTVVLVLDRRATERLQPVAGDGNRPILMGASLGIGATFGA